MKSKKSRLFVSDGCAIRQDSLLLALGFNADPEQTSSRVAFQLGGEWKHFDVRFDSIISVAACGSLGYALGSKGSVFELPLGEGVTREIFNSQVRSWVIEPAVKFGELTRIRSIAGTPYCCGQSGQIYSLSNGEWIRMNLGINSDEFNLENIDGTTPHNIYTAGCNGVMLHHDGNKWARIPLPTNLNISNIRCESDGTCYACGDDGLLLRGHDEVWEVIGDPAPDKNYWGLDIFNGTPFLSHGKGIDYLQSNQIVPTTLPNNGKRTFYHLHSNSDHLYSFGTDHILKFDNGTWSVLDIPN